MTKKTGLTVIILAAGKGQRMKSALPKVCHPVGNAPMIWHALNAGRQLEATQMIAVISPQTPAVEEVLKDFATSQNVIVSTAHQVTQEGTGHAVIAALPTIQYPDQDIMVLYGDTPLLTQQTLQKLIAMRQTMHSDVVVLGMRPTDPGRYGRIFTKADGQIERIVEYTNATQEERQNNLCNSGVMLISGAHYAHLLSLLTNDNKQGEYLLTDVIEHAQNQGLKTHCCEGDAEELQGINNRQDLAMCEAYIQNRWRQEAMLNGVTLVDPQTVYFSYDTQIESDVTIYPHVYLGPQVRIASGTKILSYSHLEGSTIANNATVGPFARLRPGTQLEDEVRIGNFVEVKKAHLHKKAKVNHLSYIGDAEVGESANIGAGTITCNYDGFEKHQTRIGKNTFVGSNTALVAPVDIGDHAIIAAGSVITKNVEPDAIAMTRSDQKELKGAAHRFREKKSKLKVMNKKG